MDMHELVGAYALDAVSDEEARAFEAHLAECETCRAELDGYAAVVEELAAPGEGEREDDALVADLPASLQASVMAEAARTAQVPAAPDDAADPAIAGAGGASVASLSERRERHWLPRMVAAAAAVVAVLAVGIGLYASRDLDGQALADVERVQAAGDVIEVPLGLGQATAYVSVTEGLAVTGDTPELPEGQEYQMWIVPADGSDPIPGPTMDGGEANAAWLHSLEGAAAVAVSVEPSGGSATPTEVVTAVEL